MTDLEIDPLPDTLALKPFETPQSLISRIAAMNAAGSAREFCKDFLLDFNRIANGDAAELERLAILTGADAKELKRAAILVIKRGHSELNGETLSSGRLRRTRLRVCVDCLEEDMRSAPGLRGDAAVACRAYFLIDPIRTCPLHGRSFVQIADQHSLGAHRGDYSVALGDALEALDELKAASVRREQSAFERYLMGRLGFTDRTSVELLDALPVTEVTRICERIGVFRLLGPKGKLTDLDENGWWAAAQSGFSVLAGGVDGVRDFVTAAHDQASAAQRRGLSNTIFGRFHYFLNSEAAHESLLPIKQVIADRLSELLPYGPDDAPLFGVWFTRRHWHTLISAERQYGIPARTIKKAVERKGIYQRLNRAFGKTRFAIPVDELEELLVSPGTLIRRSEVVARTGAHANDFLALEEAGLLLPASGKAYMANAMYRRGDVVTLEKALLSSATPVADEQDGWVTVHSAYQSTSWSRAEVFTRVASGAVPTRNIKGLKSVASVRVNLEELRRLHPLFGRDVLSMEETAALLRVSDTVVNQLVKTKRIPAHNLRNVRTGKLKIALCLEDVAAFQATYISVSEIWRRRGFRLNQVNPLLRSRGLAPVFPSDELRCTFYLRTEVDAVVPPRVTT